MKKIFAVYKPKGVSSYEIVRKFKGKYPGEKIGHGGTLDPLAKGVLIIGIGSKATRNLTSVLKDAEKEYIATIELGKISETDDAEGPIKDLEVRQIPSKKEIISVLASFIGTINQVPPRYSATKVRGKPAYKRARAGEVFKLKPKRIKIHDIELLEYNYPTLNIKITTGSGVYIRSLARDVGEKLDTGAYLKELTRTRVGKFNVFV